MFRNPPARRCAAKKRRHDVWSPRRLAKTQNAQARLQAFRGPKDDGTPSRPRLEVLNETEREAHMPSVGAYDTAASKSPSWADSCGVGLRASSASLTPAPTNVVRAQVRPRRASAARGVRRRRDRAVGGLWFNSLLCGSHGVPSYACGVVGGGSRPRRGVPRGYSEGGSRVRPCVVAVSHGAPVLCLWCRGPSTCMSGDSRKAALVGRSEKGAFPLSQGFSTSTPAAFVFILFIDSRPKRLIAASRARAAST